MIKIVKNNQAIIRKISENKISYNLVTGDLSPNLSLAVTEAKDFSETEICQNDRIYYILEGEMITMIEGEKVSVQVGDSFFISKGSEYTMSGTFRAVVVNSPAYNLPKEEE